MCGIVGGVGPSIQATEVFDGLKRLEYRGYDSAGMALVGAEGVEVIRAATGSHSLDELKGRLSGLAPGANLVVGHTRWATHGAPTLGNAHPHTDCTGRVVLVHNGIVDNFRELRGEVLALGHELKSETDSEVIAHLIEDGLAAGMEPAEAVASVFSRLLGHMALVVAFAQLPLTIFGIRRTSPLLVAAGDGRSFFASDAPAVLDVATSFYEMPEDRVIAIGEPAKGAAGTSVLVPLAIDWASQDVELVGYQSFYEMELAQEGEAFSDTVSSLIDEDGGAVVDELKVDPYELKRLRKVTVVGCGTSYHAGLVGRFLIEHFAKIPVEVDVASEYRYRDPILDDDHLVVGVSQSGESLDTITAVKGAAAAGAKTLAVTNVIGSQLSRLADTVLYTRAGPEVSVASTKTHVSQVGALALFAIYLGELKGHMYPEEAREARSSLRDVASAIEGALARRAEYEESLAPFVGTDRFFFIGRNLQYPVALEGALKLKELSYLAAEAYPAGELKHGPIAMLDSEAVVVALVPRDRLREKVLANIEEVRARGARVIVVAFDGDPEAATLAETALFVPEVRPIWSPLVTVIPLQVMAGAIARSRGLNLDRPRNLAKTVTVE